MEMPAETLYEGKFLRLVKRGHWEYAERSSATGAVTIIAITDERKLLMVEQYRIPLDAHVIELPAGLAGDTAAGQDLSLAETARRELLEETGYDAGQMRPLVTGPTSAGLSNEVMSFFHATKLRRVTAGGGDEHEQITVHEAPVDRILDWVRQQETAGKIVDPKIFAGLWLVGQST